MNPVSRAELKLVLADRFQKNLKQSEIFLTMGWMFLSECGVSVELLKDGSLNSSSGCSPSVEYEGFLQADPFGSFRSTVDWPVSSRRFPESGDCHPVWPRAVLVFPIPWAVEVPFLLSGSGRVQNFKEEL